MSGEVGRIGDIRPWETVFSDEDRQIYSLYRRPNREPFPWGSHALLVIDATEAFVGDRVPTLEAATLRRTACGLPAWSAVENIARLVAGFRRLGLPIIYTTAADESVVGGATVGAPEAGEGNRIVPDLSPTLGEVVIQKPRASAFFATPFAAYLVRNSIRGLVLTGGTTSGCVRGTAVDGSSQGFSVAIAHDACFDRSQLSHNVALMELDAKYGMVVSSEFVLERTEASRMIQATTMG